MGGPVVDRSEAARAPHSRRGRVAAVVFVILVVVLCGGVGGGSAITATHCCLGQAARRAGGAHCNNDEEVGERATAGAGNGDESIEAARGQTTINQKVAAKSLCNKLNITKEKSS